MAEATLGNLVYFIRAKNEEFKRVVKETDDFIRKLDGTFNKGKQQAKEYGKSVTDSLEKARKSIQQHKETLQSLAISSGAAFAVLAVGTKRSVKELTEFQNSLTGLSSVAKAFNQDIDATQKAAVDLAEDGLMTVADAATGLKNLLASGFNLDQAIQLMTRFKDIASFNRQASLGFGEAIRGATEGIKNGNSILVDNIGLSKNLSKIMKEMGYSEQDVMNVTSDLNVRMAMFNGLIKETNPYIGDAGKLAGMLGGQLNKLDANTKKFYQSLGSAVEGPVTNFLDKVNEILTKTTDWINKNKELVGTLAVIVTGSTGAILAISTTVLAIDKLIGVLKTAITLITGSKIAFAFQAWAGGAATAAEAMGFLATSFTPFLIGGTIIVGLYLIIKLFKDIRENARLAALDIQATSNIADLLAEQKRIEKILEKQQKIYDAETLAINNLVNAGISREQAEKMMPRTVSKERIESLTSRKSEIQTQIDNIGKKQASNKNLTMPESIDIVATEKSSAEDLNKLQERLMIERLERQKRFREAEINEELSRYAEERRIAGQNDALIEEADRSHKERLMAIDEKYAEQERQRNQELTDEIIQMTGTKEQQEELYIQRHKEQMEQDGYNFQQIEDWKAAYHQQKLQERAAYEADWISSIITRQRTLEDFWKELMNKLVYEYIYNFLFKIKAANAAAGSDTSFWGALFGAFKMMFGGGGAVAAAGASVAGAVVPSASRGMLVPAAANGMVVPPSFGSDTVLSALTPKEMVLPVDISEGLQNLIRQGNQPQQVTNNVTNNYIDAIDQQSVAQFFYKNRDQVVGIVQDNQRRGGVLRQSEE